MACMWGIDRQERRDGEPVGRREDGQVDGGWAGWRTNGRRWAGGWAECSLAGRWVGGRRRAGELPGRQANGKCPAVGLSGRQTGGSVGGQVRRLADRCQRVNGWAAGQVGGLAG